MAILQKIDEDFDTESRNIILNVLLNCFNYNTRKNNNDLNIFFVPFLPNNEKYYILKGVDNKKPLIFLSLYDQKTKDKNFNVYDTSFFCRDFLYEYLNNIKKIEKIKKLQNKTFEDNNLEELNDKYQKLKKEIEDFELTDEYIDYVKLLEDYKENQQKISAFYVKDYQKLPEIKKLYDNRTNFSIIKDKIKKLQEEDFKTIQQLQVTSKELNDKISENINVKKYISNKEDIQTLKINLEKMYDNKSSKQKNFTTTIKKLESKTRKVEELQTVLYSPILICKIFALINGIKISNNNTKYLLNKNIEENGIIVENNKQLHDNILNNYYLNIDYTVNYRKIPNILNNLEKYIKKCKIVDFGKEDLKKCEESIDYYYHIPNGLNKEEKTEILNEYIKNADNADYEKLKELKKDIEEEQ